MSSRPQKNAFPYLKTLGNWRFWLRCAVRFNQQKGLDAVAILAYTSLIGIVPMLGVMLALFSVSNYFAEFEALVMGQVVQNLMPSSHLVIQDYLLQFSMQATQLKWPGLVVMLITVLMLLWKVDQKLNQLWPHARKRRWWVSLLHYLGISLLGPILLGLSLVMSSAILALPLINETTPVVEKLLFGLKLVPVLMSWVGFTLLFKFVPAGRVSSRSALIGGFFAMVQMELLKVGFAYYIKLFPTYDLIYGAFAAVPLFLLWLYLLWFVVIWNGAVVATLSEQRLQWSAPEMSGAPSSVTPSCP
ncbi:MAG: YihY family inner membrane protein [Thiotrichales bacterium]|nr:YihY family inner membrane protein [Thiotrichales bacterium]